MTREEAIQHLENMKWLKVYDNTTVNGRPLERVIEDIIDLLKRSFSPKEVYDIVIEHAQHDKRFNGNCGHALEHQQLLGDNVLFHEQYNYCPECGQAVKWDG